MRPIYRDECHPLGTVATLDFHEGIVGPKASDRIESNAIDHYEGSRWGSDDPLGPLLLGRGLRLRFLSIWTRARITWFICHGDYLPRQTAMDPSNSTICKDRG